MKLWLHLIFYFELCYGRKYRLTRLHCGDDKSLLVISYANFLTVFLQFSDDSKYLSSCHKEEITARICSVKGDAHVVQIAIATGFYMWYCRWQLRFILSDFQCLLAFIRSFFFFFLSFFFFIWVVLFLLQKAESAKIYEKYPFLVLFGATDRNFTEKYSIVIAIVFYFYFDLHSH